MSSKQNEKAAVIDVGSNSIKLIVASLGESEPLNIEHFSIKETRIGEGITGNTPKLTHSAIERGSQAILELVSESKAFKPTHTAIVATSAVRDAINRDKLIQQVEANCGIQLRVLSGNEEALYIGKGIQCDPHLSHLNNFTLLDLGGGSMECIRFKNGELVHAKSLQLGCVRLTNKFEIDRNHPLPKLKEKEIANHTIEKLKIAELTAVDSPSKTAILTGGASTVISERYDNKSLNLDTIQQFKVEINNASRQERIEQFSIPQSRSDIFPAAITTIETTLKHLACDSVYFSRYNLRYGIVQALLNTGNF